MTEKGHHNDHCDADERLSATYREFANERTPQHLDDRILSLAKQAQVDESRSGPRLSFWTKPLAWAAALSLCAIVAFESTQQAVLTTAPDESISDRFVPRDTQTIDDAKDRAGYQDGPSSDQYPAAGTSRTDGEPNSSCGAPEQLAQDTWIDCIRALREQNRVADAEREYASFILKYPAFEEK